MQNSSGPEWESCGTPELTRTTSDNAKPTLTENERPER